MNKERWKTKLFFTSGILIGEGLCGYGLYQSISETPILNIVIVAIWVMGLMPSYFIYKIWSHKNQIVESRR